MASASSGNTAQPRKKRNWAGLWRGILIALCIFVIAGCMIAAALTVYVFKSIDSRDEIKLENVKLSFSTILYAPDEQGGYFELTRLQSGENRVWVDYDQIPAHVINATIAIEDKRFRTHVGFDWQRTLGSAINYIGQFVGIQIYEGTPGGSTITQQLVKNITNDNEVEITRKLREIARAINLEKRYSKEQIIETYLNTINLGSGAYGIEAAANLYFGKSVSELSIAEGAALVCITKNPSVYSPFRDLESNRQRQLQVLYEMHEQGYITDEEYEAAQAEEMHFKQEEYTQQLESVQSWFVDHVIEEVIADLVQYKGYEEDYAYDQLYRGGYRIYTTIDKEMQDYLEEQYLVGSSVFPDVLNEEYPESAFIIMDVHGQIKALVGSNRPKDGARLFNRATQATRDPGSTIKPLAAYGPAFERNLIHWSSVLEDSPILLDENDPTSIYPSNFYGSYDGNMLTVTALQRSTNTIPVKLVQQMNPRTSFDFLRDQLGFYSLVESEERDGKVYSDIGLASMALGSMTDGVTPLEMAGGYQIFGNGGYFTKPYSYTRILDANGNVIYEKDTTPHRVLSGDTAMVVNKMMQMVVRGPLGTGRNAAFGTMPIAGKTGTSDWDYNQWFIGVTPYYVGVCWMGYDTPETIRYYTYAPPLVWKNIMAPIHSNLPVIDFPTDENVISQVYCTASGYLASENCPQTDIGWYKKSMVPEICPVHGLTALPGYEGTPEEESSSEPEEEDNRGWNEKYQEWLATQFDD